MGTVWKSRVIDLGLMVLLAAVAGVSWNHRLLSRAWTGQPVTVQTGSPGLAGNEVLPLPLGLMQAKEFFDRKEAVFVDARDAATFSAGHIRGAISLPLGEAEAKLAAFGAHVARNAMVIVYCNGFGCHDSMTLGKMLMKAGYGQVFVFEGGFPEWQDAAYPVQKGSM